MQNTFYISEPSLFAPGLESQQDWLLWAQDKKDILFDKSAPSLSYTDPLFRRRLSQLSKMTVEVVHSLIEKTKIDSDTKIVFVSFRGEIDREFKLNKSIIEDEMILPAGFSLSVFNAPVALATMACKIKAGYNAVFPSYDNFYDGIICALSPVLSGRQDKVIFVYADELIPEHYKDVAPQNKPPLAFASILSKEPLKDSKSLEFDISQIKSNVYDFLKLILNKCYN